MRPYDWLLIIALFSACGADTGGELVQANIAIAAMSEDASQPSMQFVTKTGWTVELTQAVVAVKSILVYAPSDTERSSWSRLVLGRARAHGGYDPFNGRRVRLEHVGPTIVDVARAGVQALGPLAAEAGPTRSASLVFGELTDRTGQAWVSGTARRDGEVIPFEGALSLEDEALLRRVDDVHVADSIVAGGTFILRVDPARWFAEAHFDRLPSVAQGPRQIVSTTQVHTAWLLAARSSASYSAEWINP